MQQDHPFPPAFVDTFPAGLSDDYQLQEEMKPYLLQEAHPDFSRPHMNVHCRTAFISCLPNTTCHSFIRHANREHTWGLSLPFQKDFLTIGLTSALSPLPLEHAGALK